MPPITSPVDLSNTCPCPHRASVVVLFGSMTSRPAHHRSPGDDTVAFVQKSPAPQWASLVADGAHASQTKGGNASRIVNKEPRC